MKKKFLGLVATLCLLLCFATAAYSAEFITITSAGQVVDSIIYRGITVDAIYTPYKNLGSAYDSDTTYCCAAFVKKFYSSVYGVTPYNLSSTSSTPRVSGGSFSVTSSPQKGDVVRFNNETHWAIVKEVNGDNITIIQQNAWWSKKTQAQVGVVISASSSDYTFFRYSGYLPDYPNPISAGKTSIPVVKLSGKNVTVEWDYSGNATSFDVYLLQEPCGWEDIKYRSLNHSASERSYTFSNVKEGAYYAFVIARPNADDVQSGWSPFKVVNNGVALNYWGEDVKRLQETLNGMTGTKLGTDGWYGPNTEKAVKAYQQKKGLTADGWYGASTKAALEDEVKTMQKMLNAVTGTSLGADGWFGPNTQKAVKAYQQKKGLTVDGWYGGITKAALEADYSDLTSPTQSASTTTPTTAPAPTSVPISTPIEAVEPEISEQPSIGENTPNTTSNNDDSSSVLTVYGGDTLQIAVDDKMADFGDAQPFIDTNSRTQVPIRAVSELLNCTVDWDPVTRSATITRANGDTIVIAIGSVEMTVNGSKVTMDTAALIANDRTYIPLRCVAEAFGLTVDWI